MHPEGLARYLAESPRIPAAQLGGAVSRREPRLPGDAAQGPRVRPAVQHRLLLQFPGKKDKRILVVCFLLS